MRGLRRRPRHPFLVVGFATVAFAAALALEDVGNVWLLTGLAAALSLLLVLRSRLAIRRLFVADLPSVLLGLGGGALMAFATHAGYRLLQGPYPGLRPQVRALYEALQDPPGPLAAMPVVLFVVLVEEIVWRGVLVEGLRQRLSRPRILGVATFAYVLPQIGSLNPALALAAFGMGAVWTGLRLVSRGLWAPLLCHLTWDLAIFYLWPLPGN